MPKRKSNPCEAPPPQALPLSSLDAALDLLVCDTFTRLDSIACKFESCAGVKLNDGVVKARWEEAVKRYWVIKSMDELTCSGKKRECRGSADDDEMKEGDGNEQGDIDTKGRPLPKLHPGAPVVHSMNSEEEQEWRKWVPKKGDVVLVETAEQGLWPGKIIDKKVFFQGRTVPRGNHFFPVRIYNEEMQPIVTVKARLVPLHMRSNPPLLASPSLLSAYHHAANPTTFDMLANARESLAAHGRLHPGVTSDADEAQYKAEREAWNQEVNWVMNERRLEKLRTTTEEREQKLREVAVCKPSSIRVYESEGSADPCDDGKFNELFGCSKKRRPNMTDGKAMSEPLASIFGVSAPVPRTPPRTSSPSMASFIRPSLANPDRSNSPRRTPTRGNKRRSFTGLGELSPAPRRTYTPPRILPSGDETAPPGPGSSSMLPPEVQSAKFDFVSPLGPVKMGTLTPEYQASLSVRPNMGRSGSLEIVKEEEEEEDGWTVVQRKTRRAGSEPLKQGQGQAVVNGKRADEEDMEL